MKKLLIVVVAAGVIAVQFMVLRDYWLTQLGGFLIYQDAIAPADAIVVLGGGRGERVLQGVDLYRRKYARTVVFTGDYEQALYAHQYHWATQARKLAVSEGMPAARIIPVYGSSSTRDDAVLTLRLCQRYGWRSIIVVSEPYHMRRSYYTFRKVFRNSGIAVRMFPVQNSWFKADTWWYTEYGLLAVSNEYVKFGYYLARGYLP